MTLDWKTLGLRPVRPWCSALCGPSTCNGCWRLGRSTGRAGGDGPAPVRCWSQSCRTVAVTSRGDPRDARRSPQRSPAAVPRHRRRSDDGSGRAQRRSQSSAGPSASRPKPGTIAARIDVRPIGRVTRAGTRCFVLELPVGLAEVLDDLSYDEAALNALAHALTATPEISTPSRICPSRTRCDHCRKRFPVCTVGRTPAPSDVAWAARLVGFFDLPAGSPTGAGVRVGQIDTGFTTAPRAQRGDSLRPEQLHHDRRPDRRRRPRSDDGRDLAWYRPPRRSSRARRGPRP